MLYTVRSSSVLHREWIQVMYNAFDEAVCYNLALIHQNVLHQTDVVCLLCVSVDAELLLQKAIGTSGH